MDHQPTLKVRRLLLLGILLAAAALRLAALDSVPPGVTHDEADHARDAWGVVEGNRPVYFTTSNGREPLFDYATALTMAAIGRHALAGRLTAAWFGLLLVAATYAWTRRLFSPRVALLSTAGMALGFWPVMIARHALRTVTLPALFSLALALYLDALGLRAGQIDARRRDGRLLLGAGLLLGVTFYTYIPARALWVLVFGPPLYWLTARQAAGRRTLAAAAALSLGALLVGAPLFTFLLQNPAAETRVGQLSRPLEQALSGNWDTLLANSGGALRILTVQGDSAWRYNIAGQPLLPLLPGLLFYGGLLLAFVLALRGLRRPVPAGLGSALTLAWLLVGLLPALITGPFLSTTQAAGAQPALYVFPSLAVDWLWGRWLTSRPRQRRLAAALLGALVVAFGAQTAGRYFGRWAQAPEVRLQYETTLVESLAFLAGAPADAYAVSAVAPDALHSQAVAAIVSAPPAGTVRWFDARASLIIPSGLTLVSLPASAAPGPLLAPYLEDAALVTVLDLQAGDLDRPVTILQVNGDLAARSAGGRFSAARGGRRHGRPAERHSAAQPQPGGGHCPHAADALVRQWARVR